MLKVVARGDTETATDATDDSADFAWMESPKSRKYGVRWTPDEDAPGCQLCDRRWTLFNRRHHCRKCGRLVCNACSPMRQHVSASPNPKRVCVRCSESRAAAQLLLFVARKEHSSRFESRVMSSLACKKARGISVVGRSSGAKAKAAL